MKKGPYSPGKKTLNEMLRDGSELSNIEITDNNIRSFEKVARKYSIAYSLKKDRSSDPPKYLVFFRAKDVDVMTAAFREYTGATLLKSRRASIRKRLQKAISDLNQEKAILMTDHDFELDYMDIRYNCDKCKDTGTNDEGGRCECYSLRAKEAETWVRNTNLSKENI